MAQIKTFTVRVLKLLSLILMNNIILITSLEGEGAVIKRQAGYVYDRPSIPFDIPSRSPQATSPTQAPTVDRVQSQQMYYAYPVPAGGETVNIGGSTASTTATASSYSSTTSQEASGYNYGSQTNVGANVQNTGATGRGSYGNQASSFGSSGYNYNSPATTPVTTVPSTNAPTYLPPTSTPAPVLDVSLRRQDCVCPTVVPSLGTYLPPVISNAPSTPSYTAATFTTMSIPQTTSSLPSIPTGYLPANTPAPTPRPVPQPTPQVPTSGYIPPERPTLGISTPAPTYLPPVL